MEEIAKQTSTEVHEKIVNENTCKCKRTCGMRLAMPHLDKGIGCHKYKDIQHLQQEEAVCKDTKITIGNPLHIVDM